MKSGKEKRKERKHHSTQFSNKSNWEEFGGVGGGGVKVSQTEQEVCYSESKVESSERNLLLFQNHQYGEDIEEQQQYCHIRRMVKSLFSVQS